ncbi:hypothetical protein [Motilimonas pumila]|uniref:DUF4136 domain-containing protein n=1 Tax=Motilimonas pumila TaxID=2303987 RepID=A0A418YEF4_9GAMM|nr:hypothetical protein [Motilimonas pumila]RJG47525.1 hypothetical protein D1Z90_10315 [Motilimonas pumila]
MKSIFASTSAVICALLLTACSSNPIDVAWQEPQQSLPVEFDKTLVVTVLDTPANRRVAEDALISLMPSINGEAGYRYLSNTDAESLEQKHAMVQKQGFSHALLVRHISSKTELYERPSMSMGVSRGFYRHYRSSLSFHTTSLESREKVTFEVSLYSLNDNQLIWTGNGEFTNPGNIHSVAESLSHGINEQWQQSGILPVSEK